MTSSSARIWGSPATWATSFTQKWYNKRCNLLFTYWV